MFYIIDAHFYLKGILMRLLTFICSQNIDANMGWYLKGIEIFTHQAATVR